MRSLHSLWRGAVFLPLETGCQFFAVITVQRRNRVGGRMQSSGIVSVLQAIGLCVGIGLSSVQAASLMPDAPVSWQRKALIPISAPAGGAVVPRQGQSLFIGNQGASLFAPYPKRAVVSPVAPQFGGNPAIERLRALIQKAESRRHGYDAVQYGATIKPPKKPTQMTIGEIYQWIDDTPRQPHAIGRYQFIPKTLRRLVRKLELPMNIGFTPTVQDQLADILLNEAGLQALYREEITRRTFMRNLAKIWAGLPLPSGKSYYEGYAGNKASITWAYYEAEMREIFPG